MKFIYLRFVVFYKLFSKQFVNFAIALKDKQFAVLGHCGAANVTKISFGVDAFFV